MRTTDEHRSLADAWLIAAAALDRVREHARVLPLPQRVPLRPLRPQYPRLPF
eukprot:COSAG06_NODE_6900_length_2724_cov_5.094857_2_plen_52_part_00